MKSPKSVAITAILMVLSFVVGFVLAAMLASRHTFRLYVSVPGEYAISAPGGNWLLAIKSGLASPYFGMSCDYFTDPLMYDAIITRDVLEGRSTVVPNCYASYIPDYRRDTRFMSLPGWEARP